MKKYIKEITAMLTLVTAGVIGGSVYAAETQESSPTAGIPVYTDEPLMGDMVKITDPTTEEPEPPTMGVVMPVTKPTEETEPPLMGEIMPPDTDVPVLTTPTTYDTTPMIITKIYPITLKTVTESPIDDTPLMGDMMPPDDNPLIINPLAGRGDINGDGSTDLSDLLKLSLYLLGDIKFDEVELIEADMTMDGVVDIADLPAMRMKIMTPDTATPPIDDNKSYANMFLDNMPDKTEYKIGEALDLTGTVISASGCTPEGLYWDIFSHKVSLDDTMVHVDASSFNNKVPGKYTIFISYGTNYKPCSTSFDVIVTDPDSSLETQPSSTSARPSTATMILSQRPDKTEYKIGETLDLTGTYITAFGESNGMNWDIFSHAVTLDDTFVNVDASSFNNQVPGTYTITISYSTIDSKCSTSFTVTVTE